MLNFKKCNLVFKELNVVKPEEKKFIVLHHPGAVTVSPESIHATHLKNGWAGAGYNVYIRKDGDTMILRPILTAGAHCPGHNRDGIGVCFEGNFENETMTVVQLEAGVKAIAALMKEFNVPIANVGPHSKWTATDCPGKFFPLTTIMEKLQPKSGVIANPAVPKWQVEAFENFIEKGYINSPDSWRKQLHEQITVGEVFALLNAITQPQK